MAFLNTASLPCMCWCSFFVLYGFSFLVFCISCSSMTCSGWKNIYRVYQMQLLFNILLDHCCIIISLWFAKLIMKVSLVSWFSVQPCGGTKWETHKKRWNNSVWFNLHVDLSFSFRFPSNTLYTSKNDDLWRAVIIGDSPLGFGMIFYILGSILPIAETAFMLSL